MSSLLKRIAEQNRRYRISYRLSLILSLLILIAAFKFSPDRVKAEKMPENKPEIVEIEKEINTKQDTEPPRPPAPPELIISLTDEFEELELEETSLNHSVEISSPPPMKDDRRIFIEEEERIYLAVEKRPEIIGGLDALSSKLHYTDITKRIGVEGKVVVTIVVDKEGNVIDAKIAKTLHPDLDQIALKAVGELKFYPGIQNGKPVKVQVSIPIQFKLK